MLHWTETTSLQSFVQQGSQKFPSSIIVYVIGTEDKTNRIVDEFETVRQLNFLSNAAILRVNTQNEIISFLKLTFMKSTTIGSISLYRWSKFELTSPSSSLEPQDDHAFLNLLSELSSFRDVNVVLQVPPIYQNGELYFHQKECQEIQIVKSYISRWKQNSLDKTT